MVNNNILTKSIDINKSDNTISAGDVILFIFSFKQMKMSSYDRRLEKRNLKRFLDCTNKQHNKERERVCICTIAVMSYFRPIYTLDALSLSVYQSFHLWIPLKCNKTLLSNS